MLAQRLSRSRVAPSSPPAPHPESLEFTGPAARPTHTPGASHARRQTPWVPTEEEKQEGQGCPASAI